MGGVADVTTLHPIQRVLVIDSVGKTLSPTLPDEFDAGIRDVLRPCGIEVRAVAYSAIALNGQDLVAAARRDFRPDTVVSVRRTDTLILGLANRFYGLEILVTQHEQGSSAEDKEVFKAPAVLNARSFGPPDVGAGSLVATKLVDQMRTKGLLDQCDGGIAGPSS